DKRRTPSPASASPPTRPAVPGRTKRGRSPATVRTIVAAAAGPLAFPAIVAVAAVDAVLTLPVALVPVATAAAVIAAVVAAARGGAERRAGQGAAGDVGSLAIAEQGAGETAHHGADQGVFGAVVVAAAVVAALGLGRGGGQQTEGQGAGHGRPGDGESGKLRHGSVLSLSGGTPCRWDLSRGPRLNRAGGGCSCPVHRRRTEAAKIDEKSAAPSLTLPGPRPTCRSR